jgi:hypothetical protein
LLDLTLGIDLGAIKVGFEVVQLVWVGLVIKEPSRNKFYRLGFSGRVESRKAYRPIAEKFQALGPILSAQGRWRWAAPEAMGLGRGGVRVVAQATDRWRPTIYAGIRELRGEPAAPPGRGQGRSRRAGGGRNRRVEHDPTLLTALEALVEPTTRGKPQSPRRWTLERQRFSDESGLRVSHRPPGTSQWNTIEPRLCCHITANWRGKSLESLEVVVSLIGDTNPSAGLRLQAALDAGQSPKGIQGSHAEMQTLRIDRAQFHGEWNDTILPHGDSQATPKSTRKS